MEEKSIYHRNKILIVDDKPLNVKLLAATLPVEEYEVTSAYDGEEALEKAFCKAPDLILLDILMPGLDGYGVTRRLKKDPRTRDIPIVLVTSLNGEDDKIRGLEAGADEFLNKPVNTHELLARVRSLLRLKQYREQLSLRTQTQSSFAIPPESQDSVKGMNELPVVLIVEDNLSDAMLIKHYLCEESYRIKHAKDGDEAVSYIQTERVDVMLLDVLLPQTDGFEVCRRVKNADDTRDIQIVLVTCLSDLDSKIKGINLGADDFLVKPINRQELKARVRALMKKKAYLDRLNNNYETVLNSAIKDKLTNVYNHSYFKHFLELEIKKAQRDMRTMALAMIDIDDFKQYNDTLGHLTGDRILKKFSGLLMKSIREVDLLARYGGEEFSVVMSSTDEEQARNIAERIRHAIFTYDFAPEMSLPNKHLSASIGIAFSPRDGSNADELIESADKALYRAKREGKNRVCAYSEHPRDE